VTNKIISIPHRESGIFQIHIRGDDWYHGMSLPQATGFYYLLGPAPVRSHAGPESLQGNCGLVCTARGYSGESYATGGEGGTGKGFYNYGGYDAICSCVIVSMYIQNHVLKRALCKESCRDIPPPPPLNAQKRSGFSFSLAVTNLPLATTAWKFIISCLFLGTGSQFNDTTYLNLQNMIRSQTIITRKTRMPASLQKSARNTNSWTSGSEDRNIISAANSTHFLRLETTSICQSLSRVTGRDIFGKIFGAF
jgi:hypothetical protein